MSEARGHNAENPLIQTQGSIARSPDAEGLARLVKIAEGLHESSIAAEVRQLVTRIDEGRFFVACVGQFKRGKSTLLDAFVGEQILPTGVVPVTAVPTVLRYGNRRTARVLVDTKWLTVEPEIWPNMFRKNSIRRIRSKSLVLKSLSLRRCWRGGCAWSIRLELDLCFPETPKPPKNSYLKSTPPFS